PLPQVQPSLQQGILEQKDLDHSLTPAAALLDKAAEALRLQARYHGAIDIDRFPAGGMEVERGLAVFDDGSPREAANLFERTATGQGGRSAEETGPPAIQATLHNAVEHLVLAGHSIEGVQTPLQWVWINKKVWCLDQEQFGILYEVSDGVLKKIFRRRMVRIEDCNEISLSMLKRSI